MAALIDGDDAVVRDEGGDEVVPHAPVATDRVGQQHRSTGAARVGMGEIDRAHFFAFPGPFFAAFFAPRFAFFLAATSAITSRASLKPVLAPGTPT